MEHELIRRRKRRILFSGVVISFFTSMSKVLVPGAVFGQLQYELGFSVAALGALGAAFMYTYAFSQLAIGIFSDLFGGVRLLLLGSSFFIAGSFLTVAVSDSWIMGIARAATALGAGVTFLGIAKLVNDLYPRHFAMTLGIVLFLGYLGPATGIAPMVWLVGKTSWRIALGVPAILSLLAFIVILLNMRGTFRKIKPGHTFEPLKEVMSSGRTWCLFISGAIVFGSYYALLTLFGQKCLTDIAGMSIGTASMIITALALVVAACNILLNGILALIGGRRKVMMLSSTICTTLGSILGFAVFQWNLPNWLIPVSFLLLAIPAGYFSIFSTIAKEMNKAENMGISIALLNFFAFVAIALTGHISALILHSFESTSVLSPTGYLYPVVAYRNIFIFFCFLGLISLFLSFRVPETNKK